MTSKTKPKKIAPYLPGQTQDWLKENFQNLNQGATHILTSYPALYGKTLEEVAGIFSEPELKLILDVFNGHALTPAMAGQELWWSVTEGIKYDALDTKWEIQKEAIQKKIEGLTIFQKACLEIWANGFWYGGNPKKNLNIEASVRILK